MVIDDIYMKEFDNLQDGCTTVRLSPMLSRNRLRNTELEDRFRFSMDNYVEGPINITENQFRYNIRNQEIERENREDYLRERIYKLLAKKYNILHNLSKLNIGSKKGAKKIGKYNYKLLNINNELNDIQEEIKCYGYNINITELELGSKIKRCINGIISLLHDISEKMKKFMKKSKIGPTLWDILFSVAVTAVLNSTILKFKTMMFPA